MEFFMREREEEQEQQTEWKRIERKIYSPFWRAIHNCVAHPMLTVHRPTGEKLHEWSANKMYEERSDKQPIVTNND